MNLNNKGMTAIEILLCFSIISVVVVSMLKVVNNLREKEETESYKNVANTYKNTTMRYIESDIITNGYVSDIQNLNNKWSDDQLGKISATLIFKNGITKNIVIESKTISTGATHSSITYGGKVFSLPIVDGLEFDKPYIMDYRGEKNNTHILKIHVGFNQFDIGTQYNALEIILPFSDSIPH